MSNELRTHECKPRPEFYGITIFFNKFEWILQDFVNVRVNQIPIIYCPFCGLELSKQL